MAYTAAIFDLDGTLIDSLRDIGEAMNRTLVSMGHPAHPLEKYNYFVGDGVKQLVRRALPAHAQDDQSIEAFLSAYRYDYGKHWHVHTIPYPGIPSLLGELVAQGIPLGVLSNKPDTITQHCVEYFFPEIPFLVVAGQREDIPRKPHPAAALQIAERMNRTPDQCVFIGDTATDMQTAKAAGMFPAGVTWGFRPKSELLENGARLIADKPEALAGLFKAEP